MTRLVSFLLAISLPLAAAAQAFPTKAVRIIVPSAPGGAIDANARLVSGKLQDLWGQSVVIENRAGASMIIGAEAAAKSAPDGYTLLIAHDGTMSMNPVVFKTLPYDPQRDFVPLTLMSAAPLVVMVHPSTGINSVQELVSFARANPGRLNHATGGTATLMALELFNALAGTAITSVPYKGAAPALASIMAGETQLCFADTGSAAAVLKSGKLRALGIASTARSAMFPEWPPIATAVPGYETRTWIAAFAPAGTPADISPKLGNDLRRALADPAVRERFLALNLEVVASSGEELARVMQSDIEKWGRLVRERNLKLGQ